MIYLIKNKFRNYSTLDKKTFQIKIWKFYKKKTLFINVKI